VAAGFTPEDSLDFVRLHPYYGSYLTPANLVPISCSRSRKFDALMQEISSMLSARRTVVEDVEA
jgi:hypothetical protein